MLDSTIEYADDRGYTFVGMSESWKKLCLDLPCSKRVVIEPVYKTQWLETAIDGHEIVIQTWKGHIPKASHDLPGGIGGEVGIYRKEPGRKIPDVLDLPALDLFPTEAQPVVKAFASRVIKDVVDAAEHGVDVWWPYPELNAQIDMRFTNPATGHDFFTATPSEPAGGYWLSRWMNYGSYVEYLAREHLRVPRFAHEFVMEFGIKGQPFRWEQAAAPIQRL